MPEHIVLSPYSFVGFEICNRLMEEGVEVIGVDLPVLVDPKEKEEKELFLGRNSNFKVKKHDQVINEIKDGYFFYITDMDNECEKWLEYVEKIPKKIEDTFIYVGMDKEGLVNKDIPNRVDTTIILPTVYGPWQPENTVFYNCLSQSQFPFELYDLENKRDAIYISDAITAIFEISKFEHGIYQVQSDIKEHWHLLLKELGYRIIAETGEKRNPDLQKLNIREYLAVTKISPHVGINLVKQHIRIRNLMSY
ncbi:hypothetical protein F7984_04845 [Pradoshia sp. D12]|uniref:hypothetical protein n=1 Tax=Bacillaceae TaxID=186817 RepID=UPI00080AE0E8|nr:MULTISPECIES: hypothetical protein [Bacillaceae]OCA89980.1 hypothetical protein A8L44_03365 [Bacillus sp. FJAT-27986]QFK70615.1 hypothetical protein F7984_04845 [Pradoshia sp. D12]TPF72410.1 hypothetical protein FHY44_01240 [Bacillus sp. D12]